MLAVVLRNGWVECNSGKNRVALCQALKARGLSYKQEIVGYTTGRIELNEHVHHARRRRIHTYRHSAIDYAGWIKSGRLLKEDVRAKAAMHWQGYYDFGEIELAWSPHLTYGEVASVLCAPGHWQDFFDPEMCVKSSPLNNCALRKPIKRITLC